MKSKRSTAFIIIMMLSSMVLIALVGARGSFGFGKGSVIAFGEIEGKGNKHGQVILNVEKHPNSGSMELFTICQSSSGNQTLGNHPVTMNLVLSDSISMNNVEQTKGAVIIAYGDLVADLNASQLASIDAGSVCSEANSTVVEAFPVGFKATIIVMKNKQKVDKQVQYVCGTTIASGGESFSDGDAFTGSEYSCTES